MHSWWSKEDKKTVGELNHSDRTSSTYMCAVILETFWFNVGLMWELRRVNAKGDCDTDNNYLSDSQLAVQLKRHMLIVYIASSFSTTIFAKCKAQTNFDGRVFSALPSGRFFFLCFFKDRWKRSPSFLERHDFCCENWTKNYFACFTVQIQNQFFCLSALWI